MGLLRVEVRQKRPFRSTMSKYICFLQAIKRPIIAIKPTSRCLLQTLVFRSADDPGFGFPRSVADRGRRVGAAASAAAGPPYRAGEAGGGPVVRPPPRRRIRQDGLGRVPEAVPPPPPLKITDSR